MGFLAAPRPRVPLAKNLATYNASACGDWTQRRVDEFRDRPKATVGEPHRAAVPSPAPVTLLMVCRPAIGGDFLVEPAANEGTGAAPAG